MSIEQSLAYYGWLIPQALAPIVSFVPALWEPSISNIAEMVDLEIGIPVHSRGTDQNMPFPKCPKVV